MIQGEPDVVGVFKQVLERISAAPASIPEEDKRRLILCAFLSQTEYTDKDVQFDQLNAREREFKEYRRLHRRGWLLVETRDERGTQWTLERVT